MKAKKFMSFLEGLASQVEVTKGYESQNEKFHFNFDNKMWKSIVSNTKAFFHDEEGFVPTNWEQDFISIWIEKFQNGDYIIDFWTSCSGADNNDRRFIVVYKK